MDKIKKYIECHVPTEACNLRCHYCYITQLRKFNSKIAEYGHTPEEIRRAMSVERLGGTCLLNFCAGGETLLSPEVLPIISAILDEGHYVSLVTNTTLTNRIKEICEFPEEWKSRLFVKCSFHYLELKRLGWLQRYVDNVNLLKNNGVSYTIEITPSDELIPYIEEIKHFSQNSFGALPHITIARDDRTPERNHLSKLPWEAYYKTWSAFQSDLFEFKSEIIHVKRKEFCYAGDWTLNIDLQSGDVRACYGTFVFDNIYKDISRPLSVRCVGNNCPLSYCYNGHAFLAEGCIPEYNTPTYASERDRTTADGGHWLQPKMYDFMSGKLVNSNEPYTAVKKSMANMEYNIGYTQYRVKGMVNKAMNLIRSTLKFGGALLKHSFTVNSAYSAAGGSTFYGNISKAAYIRWAAI